MSEDNKETTVSNPIKPVVSAELLLELIEILVNACTQYAGDGITEHEHCMFDSVDLDKIEILKEKLLTSKSR